MDVREDHDGVRRRSRSIAASDDARFRRRELLRTRTVVSEPSFSWNVTAMVSASDGAPCPCPCPIEGADPAAKPRARSSTAAHPRRGPASAREAEAPAPATTAGAAAPNVVTPHRAIWRTASRAPARSITSSLRFRATCFVRSSTRCRVFVTSIRDRAMRVRVSQSLGRVKVSMRASVWCEPNSAPLEYLCSHFRGRACRAASPTLRMVAVVQTSLSALLNDAAALEEVRRRARCLSRAPNPHALRVRTRDTAKALDSSPIESRRNSRSDLRPPARSPHRSSAASRRRWRFPSSARARSSPPATRRTPPTRTTTC